MHAKLVWTSLKTITILVSPANSNCIPRKNHLNKSFDNVRNCPISFTSTLTYYLISNANMYHPWDGCIGTSHNSSRTAAIFAYLANLRVGSRTSPDTAACGSCYILMCRWWCQDSHKQLHWCNIAYHANYHFLCHKDWRLKYLAGGGVVLVVFLLLVTTTTASIVLDHASAETP